MNDDLLKFVGGITLLFLMILLGLFLGYMSGVVFDHFMGTYTVPIFTIGGFVGISMSLQRSRKGGFGEKYLYAVFAVVLAALCSFPGAWLANMFFAEIAQEFMTMINYQGDSLYKLAFWGSLTGGAIRLVTSIPVVFLLDKLIET